jgi:predicted nucleotidyltransferase
MKTLQEIKRILRNHKDQLFIEYPIKSMAIFGSCSRKEQNEVSDLDIVVEFSDRIGIRFVDLADLFLSFVQEPRLSLQHYCLINLTKLVPGLESL